jgi:hypothetical protein
MTALPGRSMLILPSLGVFALLLILSTPAQAHLGYGNLTVAFGSPVGDGALSLNPETTAPGAGVAVDDATHDVYVVDTFNNRLEKFSARGASFIAAWGWGVSDGKEEFEVCTSGCLPGLAGSGEGQFDVPVSVAVDNSSDASKGDVYVANRGSERIEKLSAAGGSLGQFGTAADPGSAKDPLGGLEDLRGGNSVAVDPTSGDVWVADGRNEPNGRAVQYSPSGEYLAEFGHFSVAFGLTVDPSGDVYVVNGAGKVQEFGPSPGLGFIRNVDESHEVNGQSNKPRALATNAAGELLVGDNSGGPEGYRVLQFPSSGQVGPTATFGVGTIGASTGIAIDPASGDLYAVDGANNDVDVFGLVKLADATTGGTSNVKGTTATLAGTVNPVEIEAQYFFEYGPCIGNQVSRCSESPYPSRSAEEPAGSGSVPVPTPGQLSGLEPNTAYHYRLAAKNANGGSYGLEETFTTGPAIAGVITDPATNLLDTTATLNGRLDPEGIETHYFFEYGITLVGEHTTETGERSSTEQESVSVSIIELQPGTIYHFRIMAFNEHGFTPGKEETLTTPPVIPTVNDQPPFTTGVAPHEATLHGTINPGNGITTYHFVYGPTSAYGSSASEAYTPLNYEDDSIEQLITGLQPSAVYHYALVATNSSGTTVGPDEEFMTLPVSASSIPEPGPSGPPLEVTNIAGIVQPSALPLLAITPVAFPSEPGATSTPKKLTNAQKLSRALKACKKKPRKQRASCERQARKKYGKKSK